MARKVFLPMSARFRDSVATPTAIEMRNRLGGRVEGERGLVVEGVTIPLGAIVTIDGARGAARTGVLLTVADGSADVYLEAGMVKRVKSELVGPLRGSPPDDLGGISESAVVFGSLSEGQDVEIERPGGQIVRAVLVEKCRYGALVELADRSLLGVGFRKVWPARPSSASSAPSN